MEKKIPLTETYLSQSSLIYHSSISIPLARCQNLGTAPSSSPSAVLNPCRGYSSIVRELLHRTICPRRRWLTIQNPINGSTSKKNASSSPVEHVSVSRSSHSTLLYALSPARFSFSIDAFHLTWRGVTPPRVWRIDPIVAVVGRSLIVAGGVSEFEDDRFAVELFDIGGDAWERCESMPDFLYESASSTWLSVAASSEKMIVTEKRSGLACSFDPETKSWTKLLDFCPGECRLYSRSIGFSGNRLIMAGIVGDEEDNPTGIELWEVVSDESPMNLKFDSIGSMPKACFDKLRVTDYDWPLTSITLNAVGDMVYIHNSAETGDTVAAEIEEGKLCKRRSLPNANAIWNKSNAAERLIVACSNVSFSDLKRASRNNLSFST